MRYGSSARTPLTSWGVRISTSNLLAWSTARLARSAPESPAGKPREFSMRLLGPGRAAPALGRGRPGGGRARGPRREAEVGLDAAARPGLPARRLPLDEHRVE